MIKSDQEIILEVTVEMRLGKTLRRNRKISKIKSCGGYLKAGGEKKEIMKE